MENIEKEIIYISSSTQTSLDFDITDQGYKPTLNMYFITNVEDYDIIIKQNDFFTLRIPTIQNKNIFTEYHSCKVVDFDEKLNRHVYIKYENKNRITKSDIRREKLNRLV